MCVCVCMCRGPHVGGRRVMPATLKPVKRTPRPSDTAPPINWLHDDDTTPPDSAEIMWLNELDNSHHYPAATPPHRYTPVRAFAGTAHLVCGARSG